MRRRRHSRWAGRQFGNPFGAVPDWRRWSSWSSVPGPALAPRTAAVQEDVCVGCRQCVSACPTGAISLNSDGKAAVDTARCRGCAICEQVCPVGAIRISAPARPERG